MDPVTWVALGLAAVAVIGAALPLLPGGALSVVAVLLYWWSTGYAAPSTALVVVLVAVGLLTMVVDYFGGAIAARAGGASALTTAAAVVVGVLLLFVAGPIGFVAGVAATVFAVEFAQHADAEASGRVALYATVGVLASTAVQILLTGTILVALVVVALL